MSREKINLNENWKFHYGDILSIRNRWAWGKSGSWNQGPESRDFDDSAWEDVTLPHDFLIKTKPFKYCVDEFNNSDNVIPLMEDVGNMHTADGSFMKNVGWYRRHFTVSDNGGKIFLVLDGAYRDTQIYLNEFFIGCHRSGYTGMKFDITDFVIFGGDNLLSIKTDCRSSEGWFYEGGGIYRDVYLLKTPSVYIKDVFADYTLDGNTAHMKFKTELKGECKGLSLSHIIRDADGSEVCRFHSDRDISYITGDFENVTLWDIDNPYMYSAEAILYLDGEAIDSCTVPLGFRSIAFDAENGFYLNGRNVMIKGVCCHQNHGGIGTAMPPELFNFRIQKLKEMGANGYRCSHYPQSEALLNACDKYGMLVMNENRLFSSAEDDMEQLEYMVRLSRNHPSVILYSIGNEEAQSQTSNQSGRIAKTMTDKIKSLDESRFTTMGLLMWDLKNKRPLSSVSEISAIGEQLDVAGFNYHANRWEEYHSEYPSQPMISTENGTFKSTRGIMQTNPERCHLAMTDKASNSYMAGAEHWDMCDRTKYMSGVFIWTGFDYYGEPTPYAWPAISSQFGAMDLCGFPKDFYYYYKSWWDETVSTVHIASSWNLKSGDVTDIHIFSDCEEVELFRNGKSLGRKTIAKNGYAIFPDVKFEPGALLAQGYKGLIPICADIVKTAGAAARLSLTADYRENDITILTAAVTDADGNIVPDAENPITLSIENGILLGASNGNPSAHTSVVSLTRNAFCGLAQFIVKGGTEITAKSTGLSAASVTL